MYIYPSKLWFHDWFNQQTWWLNQAKKRELYCRSIKTSNLHTLDVTNCKVVQSPSSTLCRKHIMFAEVVLRKLSPVSFLKEGF